MKYFRLPQATVDLHELTMVQAAPTVAGKENSSEWILWAYFRLDSNPRQVFIGDRESCEVWFNSLSDAMVAASQLIIKQVGPMEKHIVEGQKT